MRHISFKNEKPQQVWLDQAATLLQQMKDAPDKASRDKIIDDNRTVWGELKIWLLSLSNEKCWFSDAKDCFSHWDVEHYRPKKSAKDADGTEYDGYWWLAFDWKNFRICGNAGNRKKGTYFPLHSKWSRATKPNDDLRCEHPDLLDPADPDDPNLLSFNVLGEAIPAPELDNASWDAERATYSISRLNLNFGPLSDKRKTVWEDCWQNIEAYLNELQELKDPGLRIDQFTIKQHEVKQKALAIRNMIFEEKELSAVARACVLSSGDPRVIRILST